MIEKGKIIMLNITSFLGRVINRFLGNYNDDFANINNSDKKVENNEWMEMMAVLVDIVTQFMPAIMIGVGLVGSIYVIILSVKYAKAENDDAKNEAKKKLINTIIGVLIGLLIMTVLAVWLKYSNSIEIWLDSFRKSE